MPCPAGCHFSSIKAELVRDCQIYSFWVNCQLEQELPRRQGPWFLCISGACFSSDHSTLSSVAQIGTLLVAPSARRDRCGSMGCAASIARAAQAERRRRSGLRSHLRQSCSCRPLGGLRDREPAGHRSRPRTPPRLESRRLEASSTLVPGANTLSLRHQDGPTA